MSLLGKYKMAIKRKCYECSGRVGEIINCRVPKCPLWGLRIKKRSKVKDIKKSSKTRDLVD